jgi:hypothetical protein
MRVKEGNAAMLNSNAMCCKERLEEISNQQSNASKACTGIDTHRVRGTGELGAAR